MRLFILFIFTCSVSFFLTAQYQCKTNKTESGSSLTCKHKNGSVSTIEIWDKERRQGTFTVYNSKGDELNKYYLRTFAGHASVEVKYHENGQVKKLEFRSAPDGGIQRIHEITEFDESGEKTNFMDLSYPSKLEVQPLRAPSETSPPEQQKSTAKPVEHVVKELFVVHNLSGKAINITYKSSGENRDFILRRNDTLTVDTLFLSSFSTSNPFKINFNMKHPKPGIEFIYAEPVIKDNTKQYPVYIVRRH